MELPTQSVETKQQSKDDSKALWALLSPHKPDRKSFAVLVLLVIIATSLELVLPLYSSYLIDSISTQGIAASVIWGLVAIVLATALFEGALGWYGGRLGHGITFRLRYSLIGRLLNGQSQSLDAEHSAELSARVVNDSKQVKSVLAEDLIGLLGGIISLVAVLVIMFILDWRLTLVLVSCVLTGFILITPIALLMNNIGKSMQTAEANLLKSSTEWMRYGKLVKSHNAAAELQDQSETLLQQCFDQEMRATKVLSMIGPISNLVLMLSMIAILAFSAYWLAQGSMTMGTVTAFLLYLFGLAFPLMSMAMFFSNLNKAIGAASRLTEINQLPMESNTEKKNLTSVSELAVEQLNFVRDDKHILHDISYQFAPNGMSILLGESGSGKSTLLSQFLGFFPETHNSVKINGLALNQYDLSAVRKQIAWVDQEPKLLNATVRQNLTLGLDSALTNDEIITTLKDVGLSAWLARIEYDLEQTVSEQAHQFSGGEKQRFAIARALLRKSQVLLLDEPTSALDNKNKGELMALVRQLANKMKVIMITHHRELIEPGDDVIEITEGRIQ